VYYSSDLSIYIVHYTKLADRKVFLNKIIKENHLKVEWITENNFDLIPRSEVNSKKILGISEKKLGMDLGVSSRSLATTRRKARLQGYILFLRSFVGKKNNTYTTGSLPPKVSLPISWQEVQLMHLTALRRGIAAKSKWILVLEDDAEPIEGAFKIVNDLIKNKIFINTWINLNSGAGLLRTKSDKKPDTFGLFKVKPASTRCAVAYMVSRDLAIKMSDVIEKYGLPDWLPIDLIYQALLRKTRANSYWQEPPIFVQGSESGSYQSAFESLRIAASKLKEANNS
jgi:hypothetical protein